MINFSEHVYYDPTVPECLRWRSSRANNRVKADSPSGGLMGNNRYYTFSLFKKLYLNHRVVWMIHNGDIPKDLLIDHIDGDCLNNKIENLRIVTMKVNKRNQRKCKSNKTGFTGVHSDGKRFRAEWVNMDGKSSTKSFSISKYGYDNSYKLACDYRSKMIQEMNSKGDFYSDRHGM